LNTITLSWPAPFPSCRCKIIGLLLLLLIAWPARAGMQETLEAIRASQFRFARTESEVPSIPLGWLSDRYYPASTFKAENGNLAEAEVAENTLGLGAVLPAYVAERDMLMLGADLSWDNIAVKSGPYPDQSVLTLTPVAAWLHQFGEDDLVGAFVAPMFSRPAGVPVLRFRDEGDRVHHRARRGRRDPEASRESGGAICSRTARPCHLAHHLLTRSRPRPSVQGALMEAAVCRGAGVRNALCRGALSQTPVSTVSEIARGMRIHLVPRISASTSC
jgi:hypothetical protein